MIRDAGSGGYRGRVGRGPVARYDTVAAPLLCRGVVASSGCERRGLTRSSARAAELARNSGPCRHKCRACGWTHQTVGPLSDDERTAGNAEGVSMTVGRRPTSSREGQLPFAPAPADDHSFTCVPPVTALERDFPSVQISLAAEHESWRKEVHRPASHTHKWWAQRLGSVFRGILAAAVTETAEEAIAAYSAPTRMPGLVVYDCFAGSGTTLVEGAKMGATVVGRDINPVAALVQRQALARWDEGLLDAAFKQVEGACRANIERLHQSDNGEPVLYYFWVASVACPACGDDVELFSNYVFAQHAYPQRYPIARATCPDCHDVVAVDLSKDIAFTCRNDHVTSPLAGPVSGQWMTCREGHRDKVISALAEAPPSYRMYAKLVLTKEDRREYRPINEFDRHLFGKAARLLDEHRQRLVLPTGDLEDGYNTRQAMRWGFLRWEQFFNSRQLYSLGLIGAAIRDLDPSPEREAVAALFSGTLEFNNLFCSYKGEGTGAVRHMFNHHVLKPERTPLEAHPWGTPASSGAFSTLFESRIIRALRYKLSPIELVPSGGVVRRLGGLSAPIGAEVATSWDGLTSGADAYVANGDSANTDLPNESVALIVTDPPFMDNVHYSELADFFHAWLSGIEPFQGYPQLPTTRAVGEVQSTSPEMFEKAIGRVWRECARVLRSDGILAFTFHQARSTGWIALVSALRDAGLVVTAVQPVKGEMTTSVTKSAAAEPSNLDSVVVCRKSSGCIAPPATTPYDAASTAVERLRVLRDAGIAVGAADVTSVVRGSVLALHTDPACATSLAGLAESAERLAEHARTVLGQ